MLVGARQTGKTYILEDFCKNEFQNYIYVNLDREEEIKKIFDRTIPVIILISPLSILSISSFK